MAPKPMTLNDLKIS